MVPIIPWLVGGGAGVAAWIFGSKGDNAILSEQEVIEDWVVTYLPAEIDTYNVDIVKKKITWDHVVADVKLTTGLNITPDKVKDVARIIQEANGSKATPFTDLLDDDGQIADLKYARYVSTHHNIYYPYDLNLSHRAALALTFSDPGDNEGSLPELTLPMAKIRAELAKPAPAPIAPPPPPPPVINLNQQVTGLTAKLNAEKKAEVKWSALADTTGLTGYRIVITNSRGDELTSGTVTGPFAVSESVYTTPGVYTVTVTPVFGERMGTLPASTIFTVVAGRPKDRDPELLKEDAAGTLVGRPAEPPPAPEPAEPPPVLEPAEPPPPEPPAPESPAWPLPPAPAGPLPAPAAKVTKIVPAGPNASTIVNTLSKKGYTCTANSTGDGSYICEK